MRGHVGFWGREKSSASCFTCDNQGRNLLPGQTLLGTAMAPVRTVSACGNGSIVGDDLALTGSLRLLFL